MAPREIEDTPGKSTSFRHKYAARAKPSTKGAAARQAKTVDSKAPRVDKRIELRSPRIVKGNAPRRTVAAPLRSKVPAHDIRAGRRMPQSTALTNLANSQLSPTTPYLSYYDILLTADDIKALKYDWLTDNNIAFWEEWLEREILPKYPRARIVLLRPSMTFLLMQAVDVKSIGSALPNFSKVTHIFLPVNDNRDRELADGGSHWSLLLVSVIDRVAFHYDSLGGANFYEAQKCADRLSKVLGIVLRFHQLEDCPQQENSNDCGVFVCILMRHLLIKRLLNANANEKVSMSMANKVIDSHGGRKEMLKIIESLRKEGERRRSASPLASTHTPPRIE
ncbi:hypothetical protein B0T22DRAFT_452322 [Podospora appendiculata]|uniref:Ubiquitin-like protease family profile domain-containing protein n=1 Tax=Podospora appendiculata TaxID=314037 RepID=A0AAE1CHC9_9PEZI|nr:hypothetical protein B0T22DRAFT_452322 [Podospora appendiculata]